MIHFNKQSPGFNPKQITGITLAVILILLFNYNTPLSEHFEVNRSVFFDLWVVLVGVFVFLKRGLFSNALFVALIVTAGCSIFSKVVLDISYRHPLTVTGTFILSFVAGGIYYLYNDLR